MPDDLRDWIGNTEEVVDAVAARPVAALEATLGREPRVLAAGDQIPPLRHWLCFFPVVAPSGLGTDGHPQRGGFLPPVPLPRRMFAGGRMEFRRPLRIGDRATRTGTVVDVAEKQGRSGPLVIVTVRYEIATADGLAIVEEQDLVYRDAAGGGGSTAPADGAVPDAPWASTVAPDEVMLFRFSALTFNAHRIHYDHPYATEVEGYPGLIVHGPLTAVLLADLAGRHDARPMRRFEFRGLAPLFAGSTVELRGAPTGAGGAELSAWSGGGRRAMRAEAEFGERPGS